MRRYASLAMLVGACGGATPAAVPPSTTSTPAAPVDAVPATTTDAAVDASPPPVATVEGIITVGPHAPEDIAAILTPTLPALAACLSADGAAHATEVSLIVVDRTTELRVAWQAGEPLGSACLTELLGDRGATTIAYDTTFSTAYAVIRSAPHGAAPPPAPPAPDRRADVKLTFCDLFVVSGADKAPIADRQNIALAYARAHVRHPAALHLALEISTWNPADLDHQMKRAIRAEGIEHCAQQRF